MTEAGRWAEPGLEALVQAFTDEVESGEQSGAACAVYHQGRLVADLWGGYADRDQERHWQAHTVVPLGGATKGVIAVVVGRLVAQGVLDLDAPLVEVWPEVGVEGKEALTLRHVLSHQAGLPSAGAGMSYETALEPRGAAAFIARRPPAWPPGTAHGYHVLTDGWLVAEVVQRVTGLSLGEHIARDVAGPLGLHLWLGLPAPEEPRVATMTAPNAMDIEVASLPATALEVLRSVLDPDTLTYQSMHFPVITAEMWNTTAFRTSEVPSLNGMADARSLARMYAAVIGELDGVLLLDPETLAELTRVHVSGPDRILLADTCFGAGFVLDSRTQPLLGPGSFGYTATGGAVGCAAPTAGVTFAYVTNRLRANLGPDPRVTPLLRAVRSAFDL